MLKVALTGNIASGKTALARIWIEEGVPLVAADDLAREVSSPGSPALEAVEELFGPDVIGPDGSLDRDVLREIVFRDPALRKKLEAIIHPLIQALRIEWLAERAAEGCLLSVCDIPLLFELGMEGEFDAVVVVQAPDVERHRRLVEDRGLDKEAARLMMEAQIPSRDRATYDHYMVENVGTLEVLERKALAVLNQLQARALEEGS